MTMVMLWSLLLRLNLRSFQLPSSISAHLPAVHVLFSTLSIPLIQNQNFEAWNVKT